MVGLVDNYLKGNNYKDYINVFRNTYESHPNFPSLLSITDTLTQIGIENLAANVPFKHIEQLPKNFIAELNFDVQAFYVIYKTKNSFVFENDKGITKQISREELENSWTGIVLLIEENESDFQKQIFDKTDYLFPISILLLCIFSSLIYRFNFSESSFLLFSTIGLFFSLEILKTYFKDKNTTESKFCSVNKNFSCNSIINSKSYYFSKYVEFVDLPIIFFSTAYFSQVLGLSHILYLGTIAVISFPLIVYSIYLQKIILKKWCLLCLIISLIITCIGILFILNYKALTLNLHSLISLLILTIGISIAWFLLKKQIVKAKINQQKLNDLLRFKRKEEVFTKIALPIKNKEQFNTLHKINIGNKDTKNTITLFLSPSCPYCHVAYKDAMQLISKHGEQLNLEICFNLNLNNIENPYLVVAKRILLLYNTNKDYKRALDDWHVKNMNLENWLTKWGNSDHFTIENNQIENQFQWCLSNELNFAPIKIFNGLMIPDGYEINELFYFFKE